MDDRNIIDAEFTVITPRQPPRRKIDWIRFWWGEWGWPPRFVWTWRGFFIGMIGPGLMGLPRLLKALLGHQ